MDSSAACVDAAVNQEEAEVGAEEDKVEEEPASAPPWAWSQFCA